MAKPPKKTLKDANESQLATRRKFKMASRWAKDALQNPATLAEYTAMASGMKSPYVMAVTNYLCPPKINGINVSRYAGEEGNKIEVLATDDFKLKCVTVKITDATGTLIEEGPCQENLSSDCWEYTVTVTVTSLTGVVVCAAATDIPDHTTSLVVTL